MSLTYKEKREIETTLLSIIRANPSGINTRVLISNAHAKVISSIPHANRHHIAGMIAWIVKLGSAHFRIRTLGHSVIV